MPPRQYHKKQRRPKRRAPVPQPDTAGIDISPYCLYVAVPPDRDAEPVRRFGTFTRDLKQIIRFLRRCRVRSVAMESTGVYWIPLHQLLSESGFEVCLVNARHFRNVPGRKSDVSDAEWLQYLHSVGLLRGSFRPPQQVCALRSVVRHRDALLKQASRQIQHMHKALDQMNLHLHHVIDDVTGKSGMAIIEAILNGERDPHQLAALCHPRIKADRRTVAAALEGDYRPEHLFVLGQVHQTWQHLRQQIDACDRQMEQQTRALESPVPAVPYRPPTQSSHSKNQPRGDWHRLLFDSFGVDLTTVPGIQVSTVLMLASEVGTDWSAFPSTAHFCSWITLCPDNDTSGEKVLKRRTRRTRQRLKTQLRLAAASLHNSPTALGAKYRRLRTRLGAPKAITAMAHQLARILYHLVTHQVPYDDSIFQVNEIRYQDRRRRRVLAEVRSMGLQIIDPQGVTSCS